MLSQAGFKIFGFSAKISSYFAGIPGTWNSNLNRLTYSSKRFKVCWVSTLVWTFQIIFCVIQAIRANAQGDINQQNYCILWYYGGICYLVTCQTMFKAPKLYFSVFNAIWDFTKLFDETWALKVQNQKKKLFKLARNSQDLVSLIVVCSTSSLPLFATIYYATHPHMLMFLSSLIPSEWMNPFIIFIFAIFYYALFEYVFSHASIHIQLIVNTLLWLNHAISVEFRISNRNDIRYKTSNSLRQVQNLASAYRGIQIMHLLFMDVYGMTVVPYQATISNIQLATVLILMNYWDETEFSFKAFNIIFALQVTLFWIGVLHIGGMFAVQAKETVQSWKLIQGVDKKDLKYLSKFKKSCRPLRIGIEGVCTIKRPSLLKFLQGGVSGLFRAILALE